MIEYIYVRCAWCSLTVSIEDAGPEGWEPLFTVDGETSDDRFVCPCCQDRFVSDKMVNGMFLLNPGAPIPLPVALSCQN